MDIQKILEVENSYLKWESSLGAEDKIIIYGAGKVGMALYERIKNTNATLVGMVDKNGKTSISYEALKTADLLGESSVPASRNEVTILIASVVYADEIEADLKKYFKSEQIKRFDFVPQISGDITIEEFEKFLIQNKENYEELYEHLADEESKRVLEMITLGRYSYDFTCFRKVQTEFSYFPKDIIAMSDKEVFVDAGAYIGDTYLEFKEAAHDKYDKYYGFEVNAECFGALQEKIGARDKIYNMALYDQNCILHFESHDGGGTKKMDDGESVQAVKLDDCMAKEMDYVSMIKIDTEGCELPILKGSQRIIEKCKPKLAICLYHNYQDVLEICEWVYGLNLGYKLYLRHQSGTGADSILFAV